MDSPELECRLLATNYPAERATIQYSRSELDPETLLTRRLTY